MGDLISGGIFGQEESGIGVWEWVDFSVVRCKPQCHLRLKGVRRDSTGVGGERRANGSFKGVFEGF